MEQHDPIYSAGDSSGADIHPQRHYCCDLVKLSCLSPLLLPVWRHLLANGCLWKSDHQHPLVGVSEQSVLSELWPHPGLSP